MTVDTGLSPDSPSSNLHDLLWDRIRLRHYSFRTDQAYLHWAKRYILFHRRSHSGGAGKTNAEAFPTSLAVARNVAASTQTQALSAFLFLCREASGRDRPWLDEVTRAKKPTRLTTVLTPAEMKAAPEYLDDAA
jgi:hypothetical protein